MPQFKFRDICQNWKLAEQKTPFNFGRGRSVFIQTCTNLPWGSCLPQPRQYHVKKFSTKQRKSFPKRGVVWASVLWNKSCFLKKTKKPTLIKSHPTCTSTFTAHCYSFKEQLSVLCDLFKHWQKLNNNKHLTVNFRFHSKTTVIVIWMNTWTVYGINICRWIYFSFFWL